MSLRKILLGLVGIVLTGIFIPTIFYGIEPMWLFVLDIVGFGYLFFLFKWVNNRKLIYAAIAIVLVIAYRLYLNSIAGELVVWEMKELYTNSIFNKVAYIVYLCQGAVIVWGSFFGMLLTLGKDNNGGSDGVKPYSQ